MIGTDSGSLLRFAEKCRTMPAVVEGVKMTGLGAAALVTKKSILEAAQGRGWPTSGKKSVRVKYDVLPDSAIIRGVGFAAMFQKGAKPHREPKLRGRRSKHKVNIPGMGVFDHIQHPGFKGRGYWHEGVAIARPLVAKEFQKGMQVGMRKVFS